MILRESRTRADRFDAALTEFRLTSDHLTLLQRMYVGWSDVEYGAPDIDPKRPYGNSRVEDDICEILGMPMVPDPETADAWVFTRESRRRAAMIHREMAYALQIVLVTQSFRPGLYHRTARYDRRGWVYVGGMMNPPPQPS